MIYSLGIVFLTFWVIYSGLNVKTQLQQIKDRGVLRVATLNSPLTFFWFHDQPDGADYRLAKAFADYLGVRLEIETYSDHTHLFRALEERKVQLVAANLRQTAGRDERFQPGPVYNRDKAVVIYRQRQGFEPARSIDQLSNAQIEVLQDSGESELLDALSDAHPDLNWDSKERMTRLDLLTRLQNRETDYAVIPQTLWLRYQSYHPELAEAFTLGESRGISWYSRRLPDTSLQEILEIFFSRAETQTLISNLQESFRPPINPLNYYDTVSFRHAMETRYPELRDTFIRASEQTGFNPLLLASIAYQESHWKADAISPTGVRGIMMLTEDAAAEVGVDDRTDAEQSILGGAAYLKKVLAKIPQRITEPDRTWFALAAYNIGYGHLEDARILTQKAGKNPDLWQDVQAFLPLLEDEQYHAQTKYGFARGSEPVTYVANIRDYQKILTTEELLAGVRTLKIDPIE